MAPDSKTKKRAAAEQPTATVKKAKKTDEVADRSTRSQKAKTTTGEDNVVLANPEKLRKRAAAALEAEDDAVEQPKKVKKAKKAKSVEDGDGEDVAPIAISKSNSTKRKKAKVPDEPLEDSSEDEAIADQTAELLKGFESSGDEESGSEDEGLPVEEVPSIPNTKKAIEGADEDTGVIYIGRIPHGFYEHQMRAYFSQFGDISKLRLSRNKITGRSKHYAFIEFKSNEVARIVAATMNKYLLFGHILQVRLIPKEQIHPDFFKGANKRFKTIPAGKIRARKLREGKTRDSWTDMISKEEEKRALKQKKLAELGYEFNPPALKSVDTVPEQAPQGAEVDEPLALTEVPHDKEVSISEMTRTSESESGSLAVKETVKVAKPKKGTKVGVEQANAKESKVKSKGTKLGKKKSVA
ncbi:hypothetical protein K402DRAFT_412655 [Aulographum hederae CBS 113979]|uniref:RRM domain-containing protein n=1 Tax=Aulographum hederae CBS 113979 TaxID=1176131 RepID=A0A6G1H055_9PEZI|nr:hypothetical protein K402DRAFT_412655 [Aulographum hederae CBS 113979]